VALKTLRPRLGLIETRKLKPPDKVADSFYLSTEWRSLIRHIIQVRGRRCEDPNCKTPRRDAGQRIFGDHIIERKDGGAELDPANIMLRCSPCHGIKTASERGKRAHR
jgi:5-methylcytosine-specific restriction enzyme A